MSKTSFGEGSKMVLAGKVEVRSASDVECPGMLGTLEVEE